MDERANLLDQAQEAEARGDKEALRSTLSDLVARFPEDILGRTWLGGHLIELGEYVQAHRHLEAARSLSPTDPSVLALWSVSARAVGKTGSAVKVLRHLVVDAPSATSFVLLADALTDLGLREEAIAALESAIDLEPDNEEALYNLAVALKREAPARAFQLLNRALEADPGYAEAYRERAFCLMRLGRWASAETDLAEARQLAPRDLWTAVYQSVLAMKQGRLDEAESELRALLPRTQLSLIRRLLGDVLVQRGDTAEAYEQYSNAVELSPHEFKNLEKLRDIEPPGDTDDEYWQDLLSAMAADEALLRELVEREESE